MTDTPWTKGAPSHLAAPAILAALAFAPTLYPAGLGSDIWGTLLVLAVAAMSLNLISGLAGQISLGHAAMMGVGAYTAGIVSTRYGLPGTSGLLAAAAAGAVAGALFGAPALRVRGQYLALVTMAGGFVFQRLVSESSAGGGEGGLIEIPPLNVFGSDLSVIGHTRAIALLFALTVFVVFGITNSRFGRELAALKDSEVGAEVSGVDVYRSKLMIFTASSAIAALAGAMFAYKDGFIAPQSFGADLSLLLLMSCIVGGLSRPLGGLIGVIVLAGPFLVLPGLERYRLLILGPLALAVLFFMPDGVAGMLRRARGRFGTGHLTPGPPGPPVADGSAPNSVVPCRLRAEGLTKSYGGVIAVDAVSLQIDPGVIHALIGPNGSGKTTLVDCITGVTVPDNGSVSIAEVNVTGRRPHMVARLGVARTFQSLISFGSLSVLESVLLGARVASIRDGSAAAEALALLQRCGLDVDPRGPSDALSYGQSKRLELARALASRPAILILDELAAGRNETEIQELTELLQQLRDEGLGILLVDHHINFVMGLADKISVLDHGQLIAQGTPAEVRADPQVVRAYLGRRQ